MISAEKIHNILMNCLFKDEEIVDGKPPEDAVIVKGIIHDMGFHKGRLESHRQEIKDFLAELPISFQPPSIGGGGGMSFLNMCVDKNDEQWGEHRDMEALCLLAIGLDLGVFPMPREVWPVLPGSMPYFSVKG